MHCVRPDFISFSWANVKEYTSSSGSAEVNSSLLGLSRAIWLRWKETDGGGVHRCELRTHINIHQPTHTHTHTHARTQGSCSKIYIKKQHVVTNYSACGAFLWARHDLNNRLMLFLHKTLRSNVARTGADDPTLHLPRPTTVLYLVRAAIKTPSRPRGGHRQSDASLEIYGTGATS